MALRALPAARNSAGLISAFLYHLSSFFVCLSISLQIFDSPQARQNNNNNKQTKKQTKKEISELRFCVDSYSTIEILQWHVKKPQHSAERAGGRLHLNIGWKSIRKTSSHATRQGIFKYIPSTTLTLPVHSGSHI